MLLTCRHVRQLHDAYADGELSSSLMAEMHAHLLQCPECQQQVEMTRACATVIGTDNSEPQLDSGFARRVVAQLPKVGPAPVHVIATRRDRRHLVWRKGLSLALPAAAAVLFFSVLVWPPVHPAVGPKLVAGKAVEAVGGEAVVNPTLGAVADTRPAANDLSRLLQMAGNGEASRAAAEELRNAEHQETAAWEDIIFGSIQSIFERQPQPPPRTDDKGDVVRF